MDYSVIITAASSIVGIIAGIIVGYFFDIRKADKKYNAEYNISIYEKYKMVTTEIIDAVNPLISLSLAHRSISSEQIRDIRRSLSALYFKYYIYLPQIVLNEMNCLHSCLQTEGKNLYFVKDKNSINPCVNQDAIYLFEDTVLVEEERRKITKLMKKYPVERWSSSLKMNLQARRLIRVLSLIFEDKTIEDWSCLLKKKTLLQLRSKNA